VGNQANSAKRQVCGIGLHADRGWDANTVTHIMGVRAFGTQLLCEQVVGRGLRRTSYVTNEKGFLAPEYAEVYGVPFSFIPCSGSASDPKPGPMPTRVRALAERIACEITFPRLVATDTICRKNGWQSISLRIQRCLFPPVTSRPDGERAYCW